MHDNEVNKSSGGVKLFGNYSPDLQILITINRPFNIIKNITFN